MGCSSQEDQTCAAPEPWRGRSTGPSTSCGNDPAVKHIMAIRTQLVNESSDDSYKHYVPLLRAICLFIYHIIDISLKTNNSPLL